MKTNGFQKLWKILLVVTLGLIFCGTANAQSATGKVYKAKFAYHWFPTHGCAINSELFVQQVREKTKGQVDITVFGGGQLYNLQQITTAVSTGAVEIGGVVDSVIEAMDHNIGISAMPYYWDGYDKIRQLWRETPEGRKIWEGIENKLKIKILVDITNGPVMMYNTRKPILTPVDSEGMKARYLSKSEIPVYEAIGANPVFVQQSELYTSLQTGMVDIVPTVVDALKAYNWWDYLKFGNKPYINYRDAYIIVNATWWNNLPENLKNIILEEVCIPLTKKTTEEIMISADKTLSEFEQQHKGKVTVLTKEQQDSFKNVFRTKVWPIQAAKMDPALVAAAEKLTGIPLK